jgi:hypothetical protein
MVEGKISLLLDPCNDRPVKSVEPPPNKPLEHNLLYPSSGTFKLPLFKIYNHG